LLLLLLFPSFDAQSGGGTSDICNIFEYIERNITRVITFWADNAENFGQLFSGIVGNWYNALQPFQRIIGRIVQILERIFTSLQTRSALYDVPSTDQKTPRRRGLTISKSNDRQ
jgi:hypothetical protein